VKRFWSTPEYVRQQVLRRRAAAARAPERRELRRKGQPRVPSHLHVRAGHVEIVAPKNLSVFENPDETVDFLDDYRAMLSRRQTRVFLDLRQVERASSDALLLIRGMMDLGRATSSTTSGNLPTDPRIAATMTESGFFAGFARPPGVLPPAQGIIRRKTSTRVESEVAAELVSFAMDHASVPKPIADACYETLVELMLNTRNHATQIRDPLRGREKPTAWRASVYCQDDVAYFTFLDLGVGILRSFAPRRFLKLGGFTLAGFGQVRLLREVFKGNIGASADKPGRGYGLTRMRNTAESLPILHLQVLTSSVLGEVAELSFRQMSHSLNGTVFRWRTASQSDPS